MWPYDPDAPADLPELPAEPRPAVVTGLKMVEVQERVMIYRGRALVSWDELEGGGTLCVDRFSKEEFTALVSCFLTRAVTQGLTAESVSVSDVLFHLDMVLSRQATSPATPW